MNERRYKLRGVHVRENLKRLIDETPDVPCMEVVVRPYRSKRSQEQNNLMWALVRAIAQGDCVEQTKDRLLMMWAGYDVKTLPNGHEYPVPKVGGSSRLTVEEMGEFISWLEAFMNEWGLEAAA